MTPTLKHFFHKNKNQQSGQGLVEYLILVALMGIATISVIRLLNHTVTAKFTDAIYALQGSNKKSKKESVSDEVYKKKDLRNFMNGAARRDSNTDSRRER